MDPLTGGSSHQVTGRRVEGNQVHVGAKRRRVAREFFDIAVAIVDAVDERPLEAESTSGGIHPEQTGLVQPFEWITAIEWDQLAARLVVRRVEADGEGEREAGLGHAFDRGRHTDGRHRDVTCDSPRYSCSRCTTSIVTR